MIVWCTKKKLYVWKTLNPHTIEIFQNLPSCVYLIILIGINARSSEIFILLGQTYSKSYSRTLTFSFSTFSLDRTRLWDGPRTHSNPFCLSSQPISTRMLMPLLYDFLFIFSLSWTGPSLNAFVPRLHFVFFSHFKTARDVISRSLTWPKTLGQNS